VLSDLKAFTPAANPMYYMGVLDGSTPTGDIKYAGLVTDPKFSSPPKVVADPDRRSLSKKEWMNEFFTTSSNPVGHGFTQTNLDNNFACYSFQPKSTIPIKIIVLDDTQRDDDANVMGYGHGSLDKERYDWLVNELENGQQAGQLMIIAAHIPIGVEYTDTDTDLKAVPPKLSYVGWSNTLAYKTQTQLIAKLQEYPNLILWTAGHRHFNTVKAFISPDPVNAPEKGFWQVETSSLRDYPQQFRTFQINLNSDYTISIVTTNVDPAVKEGTPAWTSRRYAVAAEQMAKTPIYQLPTKQAMSPDDPTIKPMLTGSYNAELVKQLGPAMKAKMQSLYPIL
jgi:metallophosphoesterase (TIGR03768 family)